MKASCIELEIIVHGRKPSMFSVVLRWFCSNINLCCTLYAKKFDSFLFVICWLGAWLDFFLVKPVSATQEV